MSGKAEQKTCFVIAPIGAEKSPTRIRSDKVLKYIVKPVLEDKGYKVERADQLDEPGIITNQIVKKIIECNILIADLSESNPNVFYELAIRHGLKKPFIHMIDSSEKIPFDNSQVRTIQVDISDLDSVDAAKRQLQGQVDAIERGDQVGESPISVAFDLEALKTSGKEDAGILSVLLDEVMVLSREVRNIKRSGQVRKKIVNLNSKNDLLQLAYDVSHKPMIDLIDRYVTYVHSKDGDIIIATDLDEEREDVLTRDMEEFLQNATGRPIKVTAVPF